MQQQLWEKSEKMWEKWLCRCQGQWRRKGEGAPGTIGREWCTLSPSWWSRYPSSSPCRTPCWRRCTQDPMQEQVFCPVTLWGNDTGADYPWETVPHGNDLCQNSPWGTAASWEGPTLANSIKNCIYGRHPTLEQLKTRRGNKETMCYKLIAIPTPHTPFNGRKQ